MSLSFVFDASVIVSAALFDNATPRRALDWARANGEILLSQAIIHELEDVLHREKFDSYVKKEARLEFLEALVDEASLIKTTVTFTRCRDPKDDKYLELAVTAQASCIVSGDDDLLVLNPFQNISIVNPVTFLARDWKDEV